MAIGDPVGTETSASTADADISLVDACRLLLWVTATGTATMSTSATTTITIAFTVATMVSCCLRETTLNVQYLSMYHPCPSNPRKRVENVRSRGHRRGSWRDDVLRT